MKSKMFLILMVCCACALNTAGQQPIDNARAAIRDSAAAMDRTATNMFHASLRRGITKSATQLAKEKAFRKNVLASMKEQELTVDKVIDGDTFEAVVDSKRLVLRLTGIDAPEEGQENWQGSKDHLSEMISGKKVTVKFSAFYPRHVNGFFIVRVISGQADIGSYMLNNGWAWYDKTYGVFFTEKEDEENNKAMKNAKSAKLGIWKNGKAEEPWEFFEKAQNEKTKK
jgi:endonuclease YncB( thermonuclease family)